MNRVGLAGTDSPAHAARWRNNSYGPKGLARIPPIAQQSAAAAGRSDVNEKPAATAAAIAAGWLPVKRDALLTLYFCSDTPIRRWLATEWLGAEHLKTWTGRRAATAPGDNGWKGEQECKPR